MNFLIVFLLESIQRVLYEAYELDITLHLFLGGEQTDWRTHHLCTWWWCCMASTGMAHHKLIVIIVSKQNFEHVTTLIFPENVLRFRKFKMIAQLLRSLSFEIRQTIGLLISVWSPKQMPKIIRKYSSVSNQSVLNHKVYIILLLLFYFILFIFFLALYNTCYAH